MNLWKFSQLLPCENLLTLWKFCQMGEVIASQGCRTEEPSQTANNHLTKLLTCARMIVEKDLQNF